MRGQLGWPAFWLLRYDRRSSTRRLSILLTGSMIRATTSWRNTSSPPAASSNPSTRYACSRASTRCPIRVEVIGSGPPPLPRLPGRWLPGPGLPGDGFLCLGDLLVDAAQGAAGTLVPVLVVDDLVAAAAVRPGGPGLGEDVPVRDLLAGVLAPPLGDVSQLK